MQSFILVVEVLDEELLVVIGRRVEIAVLGLFRVDGVDAETGVAGSDRGRGLVVGALEFRVQFFYVAVVLEEELVAVVGGFRFDHLVRFSAIEEEKLYIRMNRKFIFGLIFLGEVHN